MTQGLEFLLAPLFDLLHARWPLPISRASWARTWAMYLGPATRQELDVVAEYWLQKMARFPILPEFRELLQRLRRDEPLSEPIVSLQERLAFLLLTSEEASTADPLVLADACLVAGAALHLRSYVNLDIPAEGFVVELKGRAGMFAQEAQHWRAQAREGQGYWTFLFPCE